MDELEVDLSSRHTSALNRWVKLNDLYNSKSPPAHEVGPGQTIPPFVMDEKYLLEVQALENERDEAKREYDQATQDYQAYRARRRR